MIPSGARSYIYNGDTHSGQDIGHCVCRYVPCRTPCGNVVEALTRLRNAVYVTYPYARKAGMILNEMNAQLAKMNSESEKKDHI